MQARKVVVDSAGAETEVPMDDLVEVGVFAAAEDGGLGEPLYLRMHRIRSGEQRITVTVPRQPARAGIDPRNLLIDVEPRTTSRRCCPMPLSPREREAIPKRWGRLRAEAGVAGAAARVGAGHRGGHAGPGLLHLLVVEPAQGLLGETQLS